MQKKQTVFKRGLRKGVLFDEWHLSIGWTLSGNLTKAQAMPHY